MAIPNHHVKQEYCETRPKYRRGKKKTAVKVFTINLESKFLIFSGIPATGLEKDFVRLCNSQGIIQHCKKLQDYPREEFTEVYLVQYRDLQAATKARKYLDERYFFGSMLHVVYAPEFETVAETRQKILNRRQLVATRVRQLRNEEKQQAKKRKCIETKKIAKSETSSSLNEPPPKVQKLTSLTNNPVLVDPESVGDCNSLTKQNLRNKIPHYRNGVPMFLPLPPTTFSAPPSYSCMTGVVLPSVSYGLNKSVKSDSSPVPSHLSCHSMPKNRQSSAAIISNDHSQDIQDKRVNKTKPKLKQKSGYFYQKVRHQLSMSTRIHLNLPQKRPILKPVVAPSFLPRHIELQQLNEINKSQKGPDGKIPLLGSFIHSSKTPSR